MAVCVFVAGQGQAPEHVAPDGENCCMPHLTEAGGFLRVDEADRAASAGLQSLTSAKTITAPHCVARLLGNQSSGDDPLRPPDPRPLPQHTEGAPGGRGYAGRRRAGPARGGRLVTG